MPFSPRIKRVLELAAAEARALGHNYVGTEHLLLGLLREGEGIAVRLLQANNINLDTVYTSMLQAMGQGGAQPGPGKAQAQARGKATPVLDSFGRDLTKEAAEGRLDPVIGREKEVERVIQVLSRRTKNNPCLIGEPGVGKTAIAEGLAQRIVAGQVPELLRDKRLVTLELSSMVAGTKYRGEFEERFKKMMDELKSAGNVILFIDELHTLIGAGGAEGALDAAIIKPALSGRAPGYRRTTIDDIASTSKKMRPGASLPAHYCGRTHPGRGCGDSPGLRDAMKPITRSRFPMKLSGSRKMSARYIPRSLLAG